VKEFALVFLGGGLGSGGRYLLTLGMARAFGRGLPYGTFTANAAGSFLLGILLTWGLHDERIAPGLRLCLGTGLLGGFTTYSTFNYETLLLFAEGETRTAVLYVAATVATCLVAGFLGIALARAFVGP
jgi:fluoride exporter